MTRVGVSTDLSGPAQLNTQQVEPDTFARPRVDLGPAERLQQLAHSMAQVRPEINDFFSAGLDQYKAEEMAQGQKYREMIQDGTLKSGDLDRSGWSLYRTQGYEMMDSQIAAHSYRDELYSTVQKTLATQENLTPEQVSAVFQPIRAKYAALGNGSGRIWAKTFSEYADNLEAGVRASLGEQVNANREEQMVNEASAHMAEMAYSAIAHNDLEGAANYVANMYATKSFKGSPLSGTQLNQVISNGYLAAVNQAVTSGNLQDADDLIHAFKSIKTPAGGNLADVGGGAALRNMYSAFVEANLHDGRLYDEKRRRTADGLDAEVFSRIIAPNLGKPGGDWKIDQTAYQDLLKRAAEVGTAERLAATVDSFRYKQDQEANQGEMLEGRKQAAAIQADLYKRMDTLTEDQLNRYVSQATSAMGDSPGRQEAFLPLMRQLADFKQKFASNAWEMSPVIAHTMRQAEEDVRQAEGAAKQKVLAYLNAHPEAAQELPNVLKKDRSGRFNYVADESGIGSIELAQTRLNSDKYMSDGIEKLRNGGLVTNIPATSLAALRQDNLNKFSKQSDQAYTDLLDSLKAEHKNSEAKQLEQASYVPMADVHKVWNRLQSIGNRFQYDKAFAGVATNYTDYMVGESDHDRLLREYDSIKDGKIVLVPNNGTPLQDIINKDASARASTPSWGLLGLSGNDVGINARTFARDIRFKYGPDDPGVKLEASKQESMKWADWEKANSQLVGRFVNGDNITNDEYQQVFSWAQARKNFSSDIWRIGINPDQVSKVPPEWIAEPGKAPAIPIHYQSKAALEADLPKIKERFDLSPEQTINFKVNQLRIMKEAGISTN